MDDFCLKSQIPLSGIRPLFQWRGGKRKIAQQIADLIPHQINDYYEPFIGGGAVFFAIGYLADRCHISDTNGDIINVYRQARDNPRQLVDEIHKIIENHWKIDEFDQRREDYRRLNFAWQKSPPVTSAAMLICLLGWSYTAAIEYRKDGRGMVSFDVGESTKIPNSLPNVMRCSELLQKTTVKTLDYRQINPSPGDLVYLDPPYDNADNRYAAKKSSEWTVENTIELRKTAENWINAGATVIASNNNTARIRDLYADRFDIHEVGILRNQNTGTVEKPDKLGAVKVTELIMVSKV